MKGPSIGSLASGSSVEPDNQGRASVRPLRVFPGGRKGGALMTGAAVRESVKVAVLVERARVVRSFVGAVLGPRLFQDR